MRRPSPTRCAASRRRSPRKSKPTTQASPLLFDLTSLQREANGRFGFSAKTTLSIAQSLYERHKALTYPEPTRGRCPRTTCRSSATRSRCWPAAASRHLEPFAAQALSNNYIKPTRRVFDNAKVGDHFAIIPTTQAPHGLSEAEQKLYDLVARRFMAVFFPSAEFQVTTRISRAASHSFKSEGKVLVKPGWLAIYGKQAQDETTEGPQNLAPVKPGESALRSHRGAQGPQDPAAGPLLGGHSSRRDGRGRQAGRRRRAARGDAGEGTRHTGDPRVDHRRADQREVHASRRARADPDGQGVPADDTAAGPGGRGAVAARADRRVGIQARRDRARPSPARRVHAAKSPK